MQKFVDCRSKDTSIREIYIVEGDSALGSVKMARNADFQAVMPVRGKILNCLKADYDKISEQIESKKAQRELFKGFIRALEKQGALVEEFDEGLWSSLVQEVVVKSKDDILFIFKNGFKIKTR